MKLSGGIANLLGNLLFLTNMESSREALQQAVDLIKKISEQRGAVVSGEEMARKLHISEEQLSAYLNGEAPTPAGLSLRLKSAYNLRTYVVSSSKELYIPNPKPRKNKTERSENNRRSFESTIKFIKKTSEDKGTPITDEELALTAGITKEQFSAYLSGEEKISDNLFSILWAGYSNLFGAAQRESMRESLKRSVVLIRNRGLSLGVNITVKDMAREIGITGEDLYAILNDDKEMPQGDLSHQLRLAYEDLLKNVEKVEIREDINLIKIKSLSGEG
jgi:transcriptional regulator with XRE-family HTH domain